MPKRQEPRYIRPEQIRIGDTLRVEAKFRDLTIFAVFTVEDREHVGQTTFWDSGHVIAILRGTPGQTHYLGMGQENFELPVHKITLLKSSAENLQSVLDGLDKK